MGFRKELCNKAYPLHSRLRLFAATVSSTLLYGSSAWTLNAERERHLRVTERKMLRKIVGVSQRQNDVVISNSGSSSEEGEDRSSTPTENDEEDIQVGESWAEWISRSTSIAEAAQKKAGIKDWVVEHRRRLWRFAGHTARRTDGRWNAKLLTWTPENGYRANWRPNLRWSDPLDKFWLAKGKAVGSWITEAQNRDQWYQLEEEFTLFCK